MDENSEHVKLTALVGIGVVFAAMVSSASPLSAQSSILEYRQRLPYFNAPSPRSALELEYCISPKFGAYGVPITIRGESVTEINVMVLAASNYINASVTVRDLGQRRIVELRSDSPSKGKAKFEEIVKSCLG